MADNVDLKLLVAAETKDFNAAMDRAQEQVRKLTTAQGELSKAALKGEITWAKYDEGIRQLTKDQDRYVKAIQNSAKATGGYGKAMSANAIPATQEFSRIIQDAPYGIQGVANNIQQLTSQFGYLAAKTGGAKNALKAMIGSLWGPAGILLAVSAITALLPALIKAFDKSKDATENLKYALADLSTAYGRQIELIKDEITELERLLSLDVARAKSILASEDEISRLKQEGLDKRIGILQEEEKAVQSQIANINKELAKTFPNIGEVPAEYADTYDEAQKKVEQLVRRSEKITQELKQVSSDKQILIYEDQQRANEAESKKHTDALKEAEKKRTKALEDELKKRLKANEDYYKAVLKLQSEIRQRTEGVTDFRKPTPSKESRSDINDVVGPGVIGDNTIDFFGIQGLLDGLSDDKILAITTQLRKLREGITSGGNAVSEETIKMGQFLAAGFVNFGDQLANAIESGSGGIQNAGLLLMSAFGDVLQSLGKALIAYGFSLIAFENAFSNPWAAIAAGVAAFAIGKIISSQVSGAYSKVTGGGGSKSGSVAGSGSSKFSGSSSNSVSTGSSGGTYVFEIEGTKLVGVLSNTLSRNRALGGNLSLT